MPLGGAGETLLTPGFVERDRSGVREIETAVTGTERQAEPLLVRIARQDLRRQSAGFRPQQERIAGLELHGEK